MSPPNPILTARRQRCEALGIDLEAVNEAFHIAVSHQNPLVAIVCSRVGHDPHRHRSLSQQIAASLQQARREEATVLIGDGTAIEPWVTHACELFHVPMIRLAATERRDRDVIAIADRVDAAYVRSGGKVTELLRERVELQSGVVRVAIQSRWGAAVKSDRQAVWELLDAGAVGRYLPGEDPKSPAEDARPAMSSELVNLDWSQYLVHCTRAAAGPWPGQTWAQYRDDLLLADPSSAARDTVDALCRIVRGQRLIAGATTSDQAAAVVSFSAVGLPALLAARTYRSHLHRWDYEPFGIGMSRNAAARIGMQPVIYGDRELRKKLPPDQRYRFQATGETYDWTREQEWRCGSDIDLSRLGRDEVFIFVPDENAARRVGSCNHGTWPVIQLDQLPAAEKPV